EALTVLESEPISSRADRIELSADKVKAHLPQEFDSLLPSISIASDGNSSEISGEDMRAIVKAIFDLKQEVDRLRRMVEEKPHEVQSASPQRITDDADWQENLQETAATPTYSLKQSTDSLYKQALDKYNGKVKPAAAELGISERTLYRWLDKQKNNAQ
ncbi:MAG TPA: hypothetical protein DHU75_05070, partial [Rikenellaceae bacterium]|nr:hypothetical protein [Rikenellaceae bacterium]